MQMLFFLRMCLQRIFSQTVEKTVGNKWSDMCLLLPFATVFTFSQPLKSEAFIHSFIHLYDSFWP